MSVFSKRGFRVGVAKRTLLVACASTALTSCHVGPVYQRPVTAMAPAYLAASKDAAPLPDTSWWRHFGAPELNQLMDAAALGSPDVAAAQARIVQADAQMRIAGSPLLPRLGTGADQSWQKTGSAAGVAPPGGHYHDSRVYSGKLTASWELDFWGKNRDAAEAAALSADAARHDKDAVWLTTSAAIATTYFAALGNHEQLLIARQNLHDEREILAAFKARMDAGTANALDVSQQEALVAGTRARIPAFESSYRQSVIALSVLTGIAPENIAVTPRPLAQLQHPAIGAGVPADVLRRRPDIAAAEARLASGNATVRENIANLYPSLTLTAAGGVESAALSAITGPGSLAASFASSLAQTIFDNGLKQGQVAQARGVYQELAADYAKAVLTGLSDTETALTTVRYTAEQEDLQAQAAGIARRSAEIARAQMQAGTVDIVTVLNTEATLFTDEDTLAQARTARLQALVSLYKALGGGWQIQAPPR